MATQVAEHDRRGARAPADMPPNTRGGKAVPRITISRLVKEFALDGATVRALDGVDLTAAPGEFVALVGPSGCGKSTLLRIAAGLDAPTAGQVCIGDLPMAQRLGACGFMPQRDLLMPWRSVLDNAVLPLEYHGVPRAEARRQAAELLAAFGLAGFEHARPAALSGGMRQRVAVARTLLTGRHALLLDEPFGALDALTRLEMQHWLLGVWESLGATVVLVTHDLEEAVYLADRVYVMSARPGRVVDEVPIPLPRPRPESVVATPAFAALKGRLLAAVRAGSRGAAR